MKDYYKKQLAECEEKLRLAKLGYLVEGKTIGEKLTNANTFDETEQILEQIAKSREAVKLLEDDVKLYSKKCAEEEAASLCGGNDNG